MLDSRASHNLMPKSMMEHLGLEITEPYNEVYSCDSRNFRCEGMIKDLVVTLAQLAVKSIMMDIVVENVLENYGMLFSILWVGKLGGTMQMDITCVTIPVFGGEKRKLYIETNFSYVVSDQNNPLNHSIYAIEDDLVYYM
jgi:hypothetical protein